MNLPSDLQRLLPYLVVALLAIAGLVLVVRGVGGGGGSATDAQALVRAAFESDPKSGVFDMTVAFTLEQTIQGREREPRTTTIHADGPFVEPTSKDPFALGDQDIRMRETQAGKTTRIRMAAANDRGYIQARGQWYELTQGQARRVFNDSKTGKHESVLADDGFTVQDWTRSPKVEGTARVDGVETDRVVGALDVDKFLADIFEDTPNSDPEFWQKAAKQGEVELFVGKDDDILRKAAITGQGALQGPGGAARVTMRFDIALRDVNKPQRITAPKNPLPAGRIKEVPRSALGETKDAIYPGGTRSSNSGDSAGSGRSDSKRSPKAYVSCVERATNTAALEKCQRLLP
jgi:hypothetical protein